MTFQNRGTIKPSLPSHLAKLSDEVLMTHYQAGDFDAFEALYNRNSSRVFAFLRKKVSHETAEELLQDAFVKLHSSRNKYDANYPFLPWLFTVVKNTLYDHFKKSESILMQKTVTINLLNNAPEVIAPLPNIELSALTAQLSEHQKMAIEMRYMKDWSFEKISLVMNTSPENIRQLISRGVKKIRSLLIKSKGSEVQFKDGE